MKTLVLLFAFLASTSFAITNGRPISEAETPHIVLIEYSGGVCTGVAVGDGTILTAAHCLGTKDPKQLFVNKSQVLDILLPRQEKTQIALDLALLKVEARLSTAIMPVWISALPKIPLNVVMVGYGMAYQKTSPLKENTETVKRVGSNILKAEGNVRNEHYYRVESVVGPDDPSKASGTLPGDSGGPLIYENTVIGIASKSMFGFSPYVNLSGPRAKKFLQEASRKGWKIEFAKPNFPLRN